MNMRPLYFVLAAVLVIAGLISCGGTNVAGGGIGGTGGTNIAGGGIGGTGISQGPITGFGSIFVNGQEFFTANASVTLDGVLKSDADLKKGMTVVVYWDDSSGTRKVTSVVYKDNVQGPAMNVDAANGTFTVLGVHVAVNASTVFDSSVPNVSMTGLADLALLGSPVVEVSGLRNAAGVTATRVELKSETAYELKGTVTAIDTVLNTFTLDNNVIVNSSGVALPVLGDCVRAGGTTMDVSGLLAADIIDAEDSCSVGLTSPTGSVETIGYVTGTSSSGFTVNGQSVVVNGSTLNDAGAVFDLAALMVGDKVDVTGVLSNGDLVAKKVLSNAGNIQMEGEVTSLTSTGFQLLNQAIDVDPQATFVPPLTGLADIQVSDYLRIRAYRQGKDPSTSQDLPLIATRIEAVSPPVPSPAGTQVSELSGIVEAVDAVNQQLALLGISVQGGPDTVYLDAAGDAVSSADFFATLVINSTNVRVTGALNGTVLTAGEMKIME